METKKVLGLIFSLLFLCAFAFVLTWGVINFNKVKDGMSGTGLYTQEDLNKSYEDGYNTALEDKDEYDQLINTYRDTITTQTDQISQLNSQIATLTNNNRDYANQITNLESQKSNLQSQVDNLTTIKTNNETTISNLQSQVTTLQNEVATLTNSGADKDELITQKNNQIASLQTTVSQLQRTNDLNIETITNLNNQIASLNTQISDMTLQIQNNSTNVTALNNKIAELEKSVSYYEQYIANLENGEQVVATFEFNGSVYNIQIVNKNSTVSVVNPTSTDYVVFNYWTVNGQQIDLSTYQFATNTKVVANVTYKYDVKFMVDESIHNSQLVVKDGYAIMPTNPTKTGYEFDGWTTNGVDIVTPNTIAVTQNTTYIAKFTKLHTVTFMYEDSVVEMQTIRNNEYSNSVTVDNTTYKIFNGWKLNGVIVDVTTQSIVADTTFIADITYKYDVKFMVDDSEYNSQIITSGQYATSPSNPTKDGYEFNGWTLNGADIITPNTIAITENTIFVAKFTKLYTVTFLYDDTIYSKQNVRNSGEIVVPNASNKIGYYFVGWSNNNSIVSDFLNINLNDNVEFVATYRLWQDGSWGNGDLVIENGVVTSLTLMNVDCTSQCSMTSLTHIFSGDLPAESYIDLDFVYYNNSWCWKATGTYNAGESLEPFYLYSDNENYEINIDGSWGNGDLVIENGVVTSLTLMNVDCTSQCSMTSLTHIFSGDLPAESYIDLDFVYYNNSWCWKATGTYNAGESLEPFYLYFDAEQ